MVQRDSQDISVARQCQLLQLSRSSLYYRPRRDEQAARFEQRVLNAIDELYTARPHLGRYGMTDALAEECGIELIHRHFGALYGAQTLFPD